MDNPLLQLLGEQASEVPEELLSQILATGHMVTFKPGDRIIEAGETTYMGYVILKGLLRNFHVLADESERSVLFRKEGEFVVSYASLFSHEPSTENTEALEETTALEFDMLEVRALTEHNLAFVHSYSKVLEQSLIETIRRIDEFTLKTPEERYISFISRHPDLKDRVQQKHLASYLGITPISLSRIKSRLRKQSS